MPNRTIVGALAGAALILSAVGVKHTLASSSTARFTDTVVGVEHVTNPYGDRFVMVRTDQGPTYGLWLSDACAATLDLGSDWPSNDPACH